MQLSDKYKIIKLLGSRQGSKFGQVYQGEEKISGKPVILKALNKSSDNISVIQRLKQEGTFSFQNAGLPKIIEFFENDHELILIKNFQKGIPLNEYWKSVSKKNRIATLKILLNELFTILNHLKNEKIVHCDLKPSNILIENYQGEIKVSLIDFGLALRENEESERKILFPLGYAAPELILNHLNLADHRTDQFALGILIWTLFTNQLPLNHPNPSIYTNLQLTHPIPDHSAFPKGLFRILSKMCHKHVFRTAPNRLLNQEVEDCLRDGMNGRFNDLELIQKELDGIREKKRWFGF